MGLRGGKAAASAYRRGAELWKLRVTLAAKLVVRSARALEEAILDAIAEGTVCGRVVVRSRTWFNSKVGNNCQMFGELGRHQASCRANWVGPSSRSLASLEAQGGKSLHILLTQARFLLFHSYHHCYVCLQTNIRTIDIVSGIPLQIESITRRYTTNQVAVLTGTPKSMTTSGGKTKLEKHTQRHMRR